MFPPFNILLRVIGDIRPAASWTRQLYSYVLREVRTFMDNFYRDRHPIFPAFPAASALLVALLMLATYGGAAAKPGDTTWVRVFDSYLWTWNGGLDSAKIFPDGTHRYEKILMHYRLKCPTGGCGRWDYTAPVYLMEHTHRIDSIWEWAPKFRVNGNKQDSVQVRSDTTRTYKYNTTSKTTDSTANPPLIITLYNDSTDVWKATGTRTVWQAGYYNHIYDNAGKVIDSIYVRPDSVWHATRDSAYRKFEVINRIELGRFITPYGQGFAKGREFDWVFDVTDYAYLLRDSVYIHAFYDGYSQGSLFTLDFELIEGIPAKDVYKIQNVYTGGFAYGNPNDPIESHLPPKTYTVDPASTVTTLKITTSGHGGGNPENAAEFSDNTHTVAIDGATKFSQRLIREDCSQNPVSPQTGTWFIPRGGGWCPGSQVWPWYFDLTPLTTRGRPVTIDYNMQPYVNTDPDPNHGASYYIEAQLMFATGPNFQNDAALIDVVTPTNAFEHHQLNPICNTVGPEIVIMNNGKNPLTSLKIDYGAGSSTTSSYNWTGNLKFLDTAHVTLPGIDLGTGPGSFTVILGNPDGEADEYARNNTMTTQYTQPGSFAGPVYLTLRTDDFLDDPSTTNGISYEVRDLQGALLYYNGGFDDKVTIRDTFRLAPGCYQFFIYDSVLGDGLFPIQGGTAGSYQLTTKLGTKTQTIVNASGLAAGFGEQQVIPFIITSSSDAPEGAPAEKDEVKIFPNPNRGSFTVNLTALPHTKPITVQVYSVDGKEVYTKALSPSDPRSLQIDLGGKPSGVYMVKIQSGDTTWGEKVIVGEAK